MSALERTQEEEAPPPSPAQSTVQDAPGLLADAKGAAWIKLFLGYFATVLGMFMALLDVNIVASSLSEIQAGLSAGPDEIAWIQTSYLIAEVIIIPLTGWLTHAFSTRWVLVVSSLGFTLASFGCAFAWNIESMIAFRLIQGFIGGTMVPISLGTSFVIFGGKRSALAAAITSITVTLGPTFGPTLGGWLTSSLSWHWIFLVNVLPGLFVALISGAYLVIDRPNLRLLREFDYLGVLAIAGFLGSLQYVLEEGPRKDWFQSDTIVGLSSLGVLSGAVFFWRELTARNPIVNLRIFRNRYFAIGCFNAFLLGAITYGSTFLTPLYCARVLGYDAAEIGNIMAVVGISQMIAGPLGPMLLRRLRISGVMLIGLSSMVIAMFLNTELTAQSGAVDLYLPQALRGAGYILTAIPSNLMAMQSLPLSQVASGSGFFALLRNSGGAIGLAILNTQLIERQTLHRARLAEALHSGRIGVSNFMDNVANYFGDAYGGALQADAAAVKILDRLAQQQSAALTFADLQWMMLFVCVAVLLGFFFSLRPARANLTTITKDS